MSDPNTQFAKLLKVLDDSILRGCHGTGSVNVNRAGSIPLAVSLYLPDTNTTVVLHRDGTWEVESPR